MSRKSRKKDDRSRAKYRTSRGGSPADLKFRRMTKLLIDEAHAAWDRRQFKQSIALFAKALRREPKNTKLIVDLGRAYGMRRNFDVAEELIDRAVRSAPEKAEIHCMLARSYYMFNWFDKAAVCYHQALELNPSSDELLSAYLILTRIYERLHRLDDARSAIEHALVLEPNRGESRYLRALLDRRGGDYASAETRLRQLLATPIHSPQVEGDAWYELGRILDHNGEHDQAMDAFISAKKVRRRQITVETAQAREVKDRTTGTLASITSEHFQRWHEEGSQRKPLRSAVLTSHARSGTTLLEQVLDSHPDLISADEHGVLSEEVYSALGRMTSSGYAVSMPEMLDRASQQDLAAVRNTYWECMEAVVREPIGERMLLDKNPELTMLLPVANRVFPEMKIIFALRDPRDVCLSCFMQPLPVNSVSVKFLTLEQTAQKYAMTMRLWLKIRSLTRADWIEVRYEDVVADLEGQARRLLEFLGLPWDERVLEFDKHARKRLVRSPTYEAVTKKIYTSSVGRWKNYGKQLEPYIEILQPYIDEFGYA
jgi:tetratricopeptide (TPR) repeat protein